MSLLITIDPGIDALGWALWDKYRSKHFKKLTAPIDSGVLRTNSKQSWLDKTDEMSLELLDLLEPLTRRMKCDTLACEMPKYMESAKGRVAARSDALVKLVFMVGRIAQLRDELNMQFIPVAVGEWNGQLPKKIMEARVTKRLGIKYREHEYDAVGIGLHLKGFFPNLPKEKKAKHHGKKKNKKIKKKAKA